MGLFTEMKAMKAYNLQGKKQIAEARRLYEEAISEGLSNARYLLGYSVLLINAGEYQKAREILVKTQKAPGITPDQKTQLFMNYAAAVYKLGEIEKGIAILEKQHIHTQSGTIYQTLGYLYVEKYATEPNFDALDAAAAAEAAAKAEAEAAQAVTTEDGDISVETAPAAEEEKQPTAREKWEAGKEKALAFLKEALEYDDEDPICLDNMGQFLYRVLDDKAGAKEWFDKALEFKESQIDTLYFLSRYDLEKGDKAAALAKLNKCLEGRFSVLNFVTKAEIENEIARLK